MEVVLFSCWLQLAELNSTLLTVLALSPRGGGGGGRDMSPRPHLNIGSVSSPSSSQHHPDNFNINVIFQSVYLTVAVNHSSIVTTSKYTSNNPHNLMLQMHPTKNRYW